MDDQDEIMSTLIKQNKLQLHQSFDNPLATQTIQEYIGENGTGHGVKEILDGNFGPNQFDNLSAVNYWIKHNLRRTAAQDLVDINLIKEELKSMLKKQSKSMSSSLSGRHYGHCKVLIDNNNMLQVHYIMMTLPFRYRFTPLRWLKAVDVMLGKDPGSLKINMLRIIVIVEADTNMIMKVIWAR
eukprot:9220547-Ditylum_brightwellii.AAC.1